MASDEAIRICYFGTYERTYPGNRSLIHSLRLAGMDVVECHEPLWEETQQKGKSYFGFWSLMRLGLRYLRICLSLWRKFRRLTPVDIIIVGFNGHIDLLLAKILSKRYGARLIFNPMVSIYDAIVVDKQFYAEGSWPAKAILAFEQFLCRLPDVVLLDSEEHYKFWERYLRLPRERYRPLLWGVDEVIFYPQSPSRAADGVFRVLFYGKFQPLQGVIYIIEAAKLLESDPDIQFTVIGRGPTWADVSARAQELGLNNVHFIEGVDFQELPRYIANADVCLGIFGLTPKYNRCIPNKVLQALSMQRPILTGYTSAMHEFMESGRHLLFCPPGDPQAIADGILTLRQAPSLRQHLSENGYRVFQEKFSSRVIAQQIRAYCKELIREKENL
ncbi:glycosyltransferase family 4 protein [Candidatus Bathyarchaeota archaeon A05DMB-2]|nr:glycosyltransferase family 4 protein [Candidatus Bathyarchaeota archaeon A05DMB-2]